MYDGRKKSLNISMHIYNSATSLTVEVQGKENPV
jgi:hypothetical protein